MKRAFQPRLKRGATLAATGFVASLVFMRFIRGQPQIDDGDLLTAALVALSLAASILVIENLVLPPTRRMKLIPAVLIRSTAYTAGGTGSVYFSVLLANILQDGWSAARIRFAEVLASGELFRGCMFGLGIVFVVVLLGSISQKLGPGVLWNWVTGRYHQPRTERCVFMFLDLRDSTGLAERLGDARFSALIRDLFFDITPALLDHDARVSHFIGDEVVLYWPIRKGRVPDASFARCFFAIDALLSGLSHRYTEPYGAVPSFKAGAHWGSVIATDVGQIKSEIVFHGDVLNVASRFEGLCRERNARLLISGDLASSVAGESGFILKDLGETRLKGKSQVVRVLAVSHGTG